METVDPQKSAIALVQMNASINDARSSVSSSKASPATLNRAAVRLTQLRASLRTWFNFYSLYDPKFAWWVDAEFKKADEALDAHAQALHAASGLPGALDSGAGAGGRGRRAGAETLRRRPAAEVGAEEAARTRREPAGPWEATRSCREPDRPATTR